MPVRRLSADDAPTVVSIFLKHDKFQNLPKKSIMASIYDADTSGVPLLDRVLSESIPKDMQDPDNYWFGNFSSDGVMMSYVKFRFWTDTDTGDKCWTMSIMCKNKDVRHSYSHGQYNFPDDIIDIINYAVDYAESQGATVGYTLTQDAAKNQNHPNWWKRIVDMVDASVLKISSTRYNHDVVETLPPGEYSKVEKYFRNVCPMRISVAQKVVRMTKI